MVDQSDLKIINSRTIDLTNINAVWMVALIDGRKTIAMYGRKAW